MATLIAITNFTKLYRSSIIRCIPMVTSITSRQKHGISSAKGSSDELNDEPVKFSTSKASTVPFKQAYTVHDETPWYQPFVVMGSMATFMIYFFILREENDVDAKFDKTLYDHIEGLEEVQLKTALKLLKEDHADTKHVEKRLAEIEVEKAEALARGDPPVKKPLRINV